jgi:hypothetical protein
MSDSPNPTPKPVFVPAGTASPRVGFWTVLALGSVSLVFLIALAIVAWPRLADAFHRGRIAGAEARRSALGSPDGISNLPGGLASLTYVPREHEHEYVKDETLGVRWGVTMPGDRTYPRFDLSQWDAASSDVTSWLASGDQDLAERYDADEISGPKKIKAASRTGYQWRVALPGGAEHRITWFFSGTNVFGVFCQIAPDDADANANCRAVLNSLEIKQ